MKKSKKHISLLHPFSSEAIGLKEIDLYHSHSKSQELALQGIQRTHSNYQITVDYFTEKWMPYSKGIDNLKKRFFPVTKPLGKFRSAWRRQYSLFHFLSRPADVTIINMSGHGSKYCFRYAQKILKNKGVYVAMVGGMNMSKHEAAMNYYRSAHHILVHTEVQRKELLKLFDWDNPDIRVVPLGIDLNYFTSKKTDFSKRNLLFVGRVTPLKRIELTLEAVMACKVAGVAVHLDIIGFISDPEYYAELRIFVNEHKLSDVVTFHEPMKQEDLLPYYQRADVLLLPSKHESFGMVMVEAMACGCAVAAIEGAGGPDEVVVNNVNGILTSADSYVEKMLDLVDDTAKLNEFKSNAIESANRKFSIKITQEILDRSIEDALNSHNA